MKMWKELYTYLRQGRKDFRMQQREGERAVEEAYQGSMESAVRAVKTADKTRTATDFLREVMKGHG